MPRNATAKKSPAKSSLARRRDAAVRKSFNRHLSVVRKESCEHVIRMMDEIALSDSLTDELMHRAMCAHGIGVTNVEEYLGKDTWVVMFNELFDYTFTVCDWTEFFELDYTRSRRLLRQHAIGYVEGLAIWWDAICKVVEEEDDPKPGKRGSRQAVAA